MRTSVIAGNWKMHGSRSFLESFGADLAAQLAAPLDAKLLIFPPALYLSAALHALPPGVGVGSQNIHAAADGAFTGEQSAEMLADLGIGWVLIGHSERRALFGETNADTAAKVQAAQRAGVAAVLCVGETIEQRRAGQASAVVLEQLSAVIEAVGTGWLEDGMIAYEPVWAIGTGETATPEQAQEMHQLLRESLAANEPELASRLHILYGGSMNPQNAADLLVQPDIDGGLIGGASLTVEKFVAIARSVG